MTENNYEIHPLITGRAGQFVRHKRSLRAGMTTSDRMVNSDRIGVIWEGYPYPVREYLSEIEPVLIDVYPLGY